MRLFLDANVIFSAAYSPTGRASALFRLAGVERCALTVSRHVVEEARRNLAVKAEDRLDRLEELLELVTVGPEAPPNVVAWAAGRGLPANDAPVLAAAAVARAELLVTGDRTHFGHLFEKECGGIVVVTVAAALGRLLELPAD